MYHPDSALDTHEFIELVNVSGIPLDLSNVTIEDAVGLKHAFAAGTVLPEQQSIVVFDVNRNDEAADRSIGVGHIAYIIVGFYRTIAPIYRNAVRLYIIITRVDNIPKIQCIQGILDGSRCATDVQCRRHVVNIDH